MKINFVQFQCTCQNNMFNLTRKNYDMNIDLKTLKYLFLICPGHDILDY